VLAWVRGVGCGGWGAGGKDGERVERLSSPVLSTCHNEKALIAPLSSTLLTGAEDTDPAKVDASEAGSAASSPPCSTYSDDDGSAPAPQLSWKGECPWFCGMWFVSSCLLHFCGVPLCFQLTRTNCQKLCRSQSLVTQSASPSPTTQSKTMRLQSPPPAHPQHHHRRSSRSSTMRPSQR